MTLTTIPHHAKIVHQWPIFTIYQWQQEMFDGSYATFEKAVKPDSVFCLPVVWDKIVLITERQPGSDRYTWMIWWRVDKWVSCKKTMKAELQEEWWIIANSLKLYKSYPNPWKVEWTQHIYIAKWCIQSGVQSLDPWWEDIQVLTMYFEDFVDYMIEDKYNTLLFKTDIMRMKIHGTLGDFKKLLFNDA